MPSLGVYEEFMTYYSGIRRGINQLDIWRISAYQAGQPTKLEIYFSDTFREVIKEGIVIYQIEKTKKSDCTSMAQGPIFLYLQTNRCIAWVQSLTSPVRSCRGRLCLARGGLRVSCFTA